MIAHVNPSAQRHVPRYIANSLGLLVAGQNIGPVDPSSGNLWADEGYQVDSNGNPILDNFGNPIFIAADSAHAGGNMAQLPSGCTFTYSVSFGLPLMESADSVLNALATQALAAHMSVSNTTVDNSLLASLGIGLGNASVHMTVTDAIGHALTTDAQSVLDAIVKNSVGNSYFAGSSITNIKAPAAIGPAANPGGGVNPPLNTDLEWLKQNWPWVAAFTVGGIFFAHQVKKVVF